MVDKDHICLKRMLDSVTAILDFVKGKRQAASYSHSLGLDNCKLKNGKSKREPEKTSSLNFDDA